MTSAAAAADWMYVWFGHLAWVNIEIRCSRRALTKPYFALNPRSIPLFLPPSLPSSPFLPPPSPPPPPSLSSALLLTLSYLSSCRSVGSIPPPFPRSSVGSNRTFLPTAPHAAPRRTLRLLRRMMILGLAFFFFWFWLLLVGA